MTEQTTPFIQETTESLVALMENTEQYLQEVLKENNQLTDDDGLPRPSFNIGDRKVIFRNRQEMPTVNGQRIHVVTGEDTGPLPINDNDFTSVYEAYLEQSEDAETSDLLVVTNTPEGLIKAALEIRGDADESLVAMRTNILQGHYGEQELALIDSVIALTDVEADGQPKHYFDTGAFAIVLAALSGDSLAQKLVAERLDVLYEATDQAAKDRQAKAIAHDEEFNTNAEALKPEEVVLVHATSHAITRDENGTVTLKATSAYRPDKFPRATVHFTVNGQVTTNLNWKWKPSNKLIVANMAQVADVQGRYPEVMADVDTYYALSPGESLKLAGALIVEGGTPENGLMEETQAGTVYKISDSYSDEEQKLISQLAKQYGISDTSEAKTSDLLREIALRATMKRQGASWFVTTGSHYSNNSQFQNAYIKLATQLGSPVGIHESTGDSSAERRASWGIRGAYTAEVVGGGNDSEAYYPSVNATLAARRQVVASGYMPARPLAMKKSSYSASDFF